MISRQTIDAVFDASRVEEVIGDYVQLKRSGSNFKGLSPFTDERTPSFMVSPAKQIWKDFSSGKGGNVVSFLMEHEHFSYPEAIRHLAKRYGIEIEETVQSDQEKEKASERESLYLVNEFARKYFSRVLWEEEEGKAIGGSYFKERGFTSETIEKFGLGYSPNSWDAFTSHALEQGYQLEFLETTGLTIVKEDKKFDRFKGRVIFPILSMSGRVLGFGGRILSNEKKQAKYLNSPESPIYQKSKVLYGIYHAKQAIAKANNCYLVEGYTDVIQLSQRGVQNVVASSGTALTPEQIRLIHRLTPNITLLFDGDPAGLRAALRGVDLILEQGMNVRICTFPEGEDPDSFARAHSLAELKDYLEENALDFIQFKADLLAKEAKGDPLKKAETIRDMVHSISRIPDVIKREVYLQESSRIMDIGEEVLFNAMAQILQKEKRDAQRARKKVETPPMEVVAEQVSTVAKVDRLYELEKKIIELLLLYGAEEEEFDDLVLEIDEAGEITYKPETVKAKVFEKIYLDLQEDEIEFSNEEFRKTYSELVNLLHQSDASWKPDGFVNQLDAELTEVVSHILMDEDRYELHNWKGREIFVKEKRHGLSQLVSETILSMRRHLVGMKIDELSRDIQEQKEGEREEQLSEIVDYLKLKKVLSEKLNRVL